MSNILKEMEQDAAEIPANSQLSQVSDLAEQLSHLDEEIERAEEMLKAKKAVFNELATKKIPEAMSAVGLKQFTLLDGSVINVKPYYMAKIDDENREQCHEWLDEHHFGDLIKHQIGVSLGRSEHDVAREVTDALEKMGVSYTDKEAVHWQTLTSWIREQVEGGNEIPLDLFKANIGQVAKIKRPK